MRRLRFAKNATRSSERLSTVFSREPIAALSHAIGFKSNRSKDLLMPCQHAALTVIAGECEFSSRPFKATLNPNQSSREQIHRPESSIEIA